MKRSIGREVAVTAGVFDCYSHEILAFAFIAVLPAVLKVIEHFLTRRMS